MSQKYYVHDPRCGHDVLIGRYNLDIRDAYMRYKVQQYLVDHPGAFSDMAFRAARQGWKRKAMRSIELYEARKAVRV